MTQSVRIIELYRSIQGESTWAGLPCTFVRLAGCPLRCTWCDSSFTFTGGRSRPVATLVDEACALGPGLIEVTGGEPLAQRGSIALMAALVARGRTVLLETSGALDIAPVPDEVHVIMDLKAPGSGEEARNRWENVPLLRAKDEVKIVLSSREDYEWARRVIARHGLIERCPVLLSPVLGAVAPSALVDWMLEDRLQARFQLQLHKVIWDSAARGV